jgi:hypothetical protein
MAGEGCPVLELAGIQQCLVVLGKLQRIAAFRRHSIRLRFRVDGTVPGVDSDDGGSM